MINSHIKINNLFSKNKLQFEGLKECVHQNKLALNFISFGYKKTINLKIPNQVVSQSDMYLEYISTIIYNGLVIIGASDIEILSDNSKISLKIKKYFIEKYFIKQKNFILENICTFWNSVSNVNIRTYQIHDKIVPCQINYPNKANIVLVLNLGQSELKIGLTKKEESGLSSSIKSPKSFSIHDNSGYISPTDNNLDEYLLFITNRVKEYLGNSRYQSKIKFVVIGIAAVVSKNNVIKLPNGLIRNFSKKSFKIFDSLKKAITKEICLNSSVFFINDGQLQVWGVRNELLKLRDNETPNKILSMRLGTTVSAGYIGENVLGELGWMRIDMTEGLKPFSLTNASGLLRDKISYNSINSLLSRKQTKNIFPEKVIGLWIAEAVIVLIEYLEINEVVISGSLINNPIIKKSIIYAGLLLHNLPSSYEYPKITLLQTDNESLKYSMINGAIGYLDKGIVYDKL